MAGRRCELVPDVLAVHALLSVRETTYRTIDSALPNTAQEVYPDREGLVILLEYGELLMISPTLSDNQSRDADVFVRGREPATGLLMEHALEAGL